jgi:N-acyl-D-aspartate/D-glutamate deacylase
MTYDLLIVDGLVVDGTGLPRRQADVAIADGKIVGVGHFDRNASRRVIEAEGCVVAPGIVDPHTHYDPQLTFEPYGTSSCYHGVTTVVAGNCGFSVAPTKASDRDFIMQIFARVEDMAPGSLAGIPWSFETFGEFLASRQARLGINAAFYVGHCNVRRWVMGEASHEREASVEEVDQMRAIVGNAMAAGAAGLSSTHAPTHLDAADRPVPSRLASREELDALVQEVGLANRGSISYLPYSSIGGLDDEDGDYLIRLALKSRRPIITQGLGARNKVDAPTATWQHTEQYLERARREGAGVYSMLMARPFNRRFTLAEGTSLFEAVFPFQRLFDEAESVSQRARMLRDPGFRDSIRDAVASPNRDPQQGSTLPPPHLEMIHVYRASKPENQQWVGRSVVDIAEALGSTPMDAMVDLSLAEELDVEFVWRTETDEWKAGTLAASRHPQMILGTSDGGAHLGRDDGAEFSSHFLRYWVREWGCWQLEEAIRHLTHVPAALLGFADRGLVLPGYAADLMIFDPERIGPGRKEFVHDFPNGEGRWSSRSEGLRATIVNGTPIVLDGELASDCGLPGRVLSPHGS